MAARLVLFASQQAERCKERKSEIIRRYGNFISGKESNPATKMVGHPVVFLLGARDIRRVAPVHGSHVEQKGAKGFAVLYIALFVYRALERSIGGGPCVGLGTFFLGCFVIPASFA